MDTRYVARHTVSGAFLAFRPSLGQGLHTTPDEAEAIHFATMTEALLECYDLPDFLEWEAVPVERDMFSSRHRPAPVVEEITPLISSTEAG